jgi:hypothetical protein
MKRKLSWMAAVVTVGAFVFAAGAGAGDGVPFKGTDAFSSVVIGASGSTIQTVDTGAGIATHLGRFTMVGSETVDFASLTVTNGAFTLTAANGDTVSGTYSGTVLPGLTGYLVSGPITAGTGRFARTTGTIVFHGVFDAVTLTGSDLLTGSIDGAAPESN